MLLMTTQTLVSETACIPVQASLERLQVDYVDVLFCHRADVETPMEETVIRCSCSLRRMSLWSLCIWLGHRGLNMQVSNKRQPICIIGHGAGARYEPRDRQGAGAVLGHLRMDGTGAPADLLFDSCRLVMCTSERKAQVPLARGSVA